MTSAAIAIHAAKNARRWGEYAAGRYAINRGASFLMVVIAFEFEARRSHH